MDRIGRLLFSDISPGVHTLPYTSKLQSTHVKLEMETQKQLDFNKADFRPNAHTHVHFESSDPKGQLTGMLVVAFHKRLGSYMTDQFSMGSLSNYPVDSELISVTSISEDDKSKSNERVKIKFDGEIFSKVNIEQSCAFWNVTSVENIRFVLVFFIIKITFNQTIPTFLFKIVFNCSTTLYLISQLDI